jgi:cell division protein ZipA
VFLWSKGVFRRRLLPQLPRRERTEPIIGNEPVPLQQAPEHDAERMVPEPPPHRKAIRAVPDRIITMRLIPRGEELNAQRAVTALSEAGLKHGLYGIFHRDGPHDEPAFSVASLTEPGTFDVGNLGDSTIAGLSFFIVLPGAGDPVARFDAMVETARALTVELDADLHDEGGSSWSVQRERYLREEIIEYRHQLERR